MNRFDMATLGTIMSGVFVGIASIMAYAKDGTVRVFKKIRSSFVAVVSSPTVWLAVFLTFVGGYWLGHMHGAFGKRALRTEVTSLKVNVKEAQDQGHSDVKAWKAKADAAQAELALLKSAPSPKSASVAAPLRKPVAKRAKAAKVASEPVKPFWPFP